jgi:hypothetical protein
MIENFEETKKYKLILNEINGEEKSITGIHKYAQAGTYRLSECHG